MQVEDPRLEWRALQEEMLRQYLTTAQEDLQVPYSSLYSTSPGFDPSILLHSGIWEAADGAALNKVHKKQKIKNPPVYSAPLDSFLQNPDPDPGILLN